MVIVLGSAGFLYVLERGEVRVGAAFDRARDEWPEDGCGTGELEGGVEFEDGGGVAGNESVAVEESGGPGGGPDRERRGRRTLKDLELVASSDVLAAVEHTALVGFGVCDTDASLINAVYVAPAMTRHGVGRALVSKLEARLADAGATAVRLNATLSAVAIYTSLGYASVGETTKSAAEWWGYAS